MRPLFLAPARPMKEEWKISPYFGVFPRVFKALKDNDQNNLTKVAALLLGPTGIYKIEFHWVEITSSSFSLVEFKSVMI